MRLPPQPGILFNIEPASEKDLTGKCDALQFVDTWSGRSRYSVRATWMASRGRIMKKKPESAGYIREEVPSVKFTDWDAVVKQVGRGRGPRSGSPKRTRKLL